MKGRDKRRRAKMRRADEPGRAATRTDEPRQIPTRGKSDLEPAVRFLTDFDPVDFRGIESGVEKEE